jgi:hypothetical protein
VILNIKYEEKKFVDTRQLLNTVHMDAYTSPVRAHMPSNYEAINTRAPSPGMIMMLVSTTQITLLRHENN